MAKAMLDIRSLARVHTEMAIRTLAGIAQQPDAPAAARVAASVHLLDRGWGRPDQAHTGADGGAIQVVIRQIIENVDVKVVELRPIEVIDNK